MTRVVIQMIGGDYVNAYFKSPDEASALIQRWADNCNSRITAGDLESVETQLYTAVDAKGRLQMAALAKYVIGMYIPAEVKTAADRMADVMERCHTDGEEWRSE